MLINLLKFETLKKWKSMRYVLLGYALIEIVLLIISKILLGNTNILLILYGINTPPSDMNVGIVFSISIFFALALVLFIFPFFEGIIKFANDLSGKQAALELMIPAHSWKKILAKLIVTVIATIICAFIAGVLILFFILIMSNFDKAMINSLLTGIKEALSNPLNVLIALITGFFSYASIYLLFYFCIAIANAISNKNKIAVPIGIVVFIVSVAILYYLGSLSDRHPIYSFNINDYSSSISSLLVNVLSFAVMFFASTWLMENKIEN